MHCLTSSAAPQFSGSAERRREGGAVEDCLRFFWKVPGLLKFIEFDDVLFYIFCIVEDSSSFLELPNVVLPQFAFMKMKHD